MGLRARLLLLVLVATVPAVLLALYSNLGQRQLGAARVESEAMKVAQLAGANQASLIQATRQHLTGLTHFPQARGNDIASFDMFFANMPKVYTDYTDFGLIETNGDLVSSSHGRLNTTNVANLPHFQRVIRTQDLAVGDYQGGEPTGKPSLPVGFPLRDEHGKLIRVLYASLDLAVLNSALAKSQLPEGGVIEVFDQDGHLLARNPEGEGLLGQSLPNWSAFLIKAAKGQGTAEMSGLDGVPRFHAFTRVRDGKATCLFVRVGIPASLAYAATRLALYQDLGILGAVSVLAMLAAWVYADRYVVLPVKALVESTHRIGEGDLSARTSIPHASGELRRLVRGFDEMATKLEQHRMESERAGQALRESEQRFRQLADAMPQIVWAADSDGRIDYYNERWYEFTGYSRAENGEDSWHSILHPDDVKRCLGLWNEAVQSGEAYQCEYRFKDRRALPVRGETGRIIRWFGTSTDIDDQKRSEEEVRRLNTTLESRVAERTAQLGESNAQLEAFSYSVSHDLRAPLRHIGGYVQILQEDSNTCLSEESQRFLGAISAASRRMGALIDDLLAFSQISRTELRRSVFDVNELVKEVIREMGRDVEDRELDWDIETLPQVFADRAMLKQVWANLLSNAVKYTRKCELARIHVGFRAQATEFEFYVRDNGAGFDMTYAQKLFGVFQRLHRQDEFEGIGIGLANVRRIVTRHGGKAWAEAKLDEGATFYFTLPIAGKKLPVNLSSV